MNRLSIEKRAQILSMLCEGSSMRAISRVADVSINTVTKLLVDAGMACAAFHFDQVKAVRSKRIQCDEIWSFCYSKQSNTPSGYRGERGDVWTWTAIDADSKLIVSWMVGSRDAESAALFINDMRDRLANRIQLTTDGHHAYLDAVEDAFGGDIDYAMLIKLYGNPEGPKGSAERRYSPSPCIGTRWHRVAGAPNAHYSSTSYAERHNLNMRMSMRRFTRLTNAFSKKVDNHIHALALYFVWYNFCRIHKALRVTPAMAAGLTGTTMDMADVVRLTDAYIDSQKATAVPPRLAN
jgi:IS1 family transposase